MPRGSREPEPIRGLQVRRYPTRSTRATARGECPRCTLANLNDHPLVRLEERLFGGGQDGPGDEAGRAADLPQGVAATSGVVPALSSAAAAATSRVFAWHPSEATGVFAAAACGFRGRVELRDAGDQVTLDDSTASVYVADAAAAHTLSPAVELARSRTLDEASTTLRTLTGVCELDYERAKATRNESAGPTPSTGRSLEAIDAATQGAARRGSDFLTVRRLAELVGVRTPEGLAELRATLAVDRADHDCSPLPLYRTRSAR